MRFRKTLPAVVVSTLVALACSKPAEGPAAGATPVPAGPTAEQKAAFDTAVDAYVYGYPLLTMEYTRRVMTNVAAPEGTRAPMGQIVRMREYPNASFHDVTAPNADTLYTTAWVDVGKEPWVLSLPNMNGRYYLFPMLDGWTTVFEVPGKRTTGTAAQAYAITGPGWTGTLPAGVKEYKSPTAIVWLLGRIYCIGTPDDYKAVHAAQDKISIVPLSAWGKRYEPAAGSVDASIDMKKPVRDLVNDLDATAYFRTLAELMKDESPFGRRCADGRETRGDRHRAGQGSRRRHAVVGRGRPALGGDEGGARQDHGLVQGRRGRGRLGRRQRLGLHDEDRHLRNGLHPACAGHGHRPRRQPPAGCRLPDLRGRRRREDLQRREQVRHALREGTDAAGRRILVADDVQRRVLLRRQPPQPLHAQSSRNKFVPNADGSVDLYIQNESPGKGKEANWLPAPKDKFILMLRLYWPKEKPPSILDGSWKIPPVKSAA